MTDQTKKNKPYSRSRYNPSQSAKLSYQKVDYQKVDYSPSRYESADYLSGATMYEELIGKINRKDAQVGVIGLGYVGLPLAVEMASSGYRVVGVDLDQSVVDRINRGQSHIGDISTERLQPLVEQGLLSATTEYQGLSEVDCVSICVPTPLTKTKDPNISYITEAIDRLVGLIKAGQLIVLESTTYPGTTEELVAARLHAERGLKVGENVFVAFSPERVDPGNTQWTTKTTPKILGGVTPTCTLVAQALYAAVVDSVHVVGSAREAETVKLLENTFRAVNIALVNEFLLMCDRLDIDIWHVIEAASTKPFGFMPFFPGPGIGGHCIPLDPLYLSWRAKTVDFYSRFIELATDINGNMPRFVIAKLANLLNEREKPLKGSRVMILGMAYKKNVDDLRESPGLEIYRLLRAKGAWVEFNDPHATQFTSMLDNIIESSPIDDGQLGTFDVVVLVTDHDVFDYEKIAQEAGSILDCRAAFERRQIRADHIVRL